MENFDFMKVHKVMEFLEWEWAGEGVPTLVSLEREAQSLLKRTTEYCVNDFYAIECRGYYAECDRDRKTMKLTFMIEYWEGYK